MPGPGGWETQVQIQSFLTSAIEGGQRWALRSDHFTPWGKKTLVSHWVGGPRSWSGPLGDLPGCCLLTTLTELPGIPHCHHGFMDTVVAPSGPEHYHIACWVDGLKQSNASRWYWDGRDSASASKFRPFHFHSVELWYNILENPQDIICYPPKTLKQFSHIIQR